jgi:hypothetical protein
MKVNGDYYGAGYAHLQNLFPQQVTHEFLAQLKASIDASRAPLEAMFREGMMLKRPAFELGPYQYTPILTFLWGLTPTMSALTERELLPTYGYFRIYRQGDVCWVHSDRYACEHSLSLTLAYSDAKPWSFEIGRNKLTHARPVETTFGDDPHSAVMMQPGDAVLYQGVHYRHGRVTPNPNRWSAHLFLHWVDSAGAFRDEAFDRKPPAPLADFQFA